MKYQDTKKKREWTSGNNHDDQNLKAFWKWNQEKPHNEKQYKQKRSQEQLRATKDDQS